MDFVTSIIFPLHEQKAYKLGTLMKKANVTHLLVWNVIIIRNNFFIYND